MAVSIALLKVDDVTRSCGYDQVVALLITFYYLFDPNVKCEKCINVLLPFSLTFLSPLGSNYFLLCMCKDSP